MTNTIGVMKCRAAAASQAAKGIARSAERIFPSTVPGNYARYVSLMKKILVVDDEEDVRLFLQDFLSERDFDVFAAGNGEEALQITSKEQPEIILLDLMMPGIDGLEVLERVRKQFPKIHVIMITALNDETRIARAKKLGAYNYILKPFSLSYLETELMGLIEKIKA